MNVADALERAARELSSASIPQSRREARSLLRFILDRDQAFLFAHPEYELSNSELELFSRSLLRRAAREPLQYITGQQEFYGLDLDVAPAVLIPRPETEILVAAAIDLLMPIQHPTFFEVGVGSGCISISVLHSVPGARAAASDISLAALSIAEKNAGRYNVQQRLILSHGDLFTGCVEPVDIIVSNPPYIPETDRPFLQREVVEFEPSEALFAGPDGLDVIRRIVEGAPDHLKSGGWLLMEIGHGQAERVKELMSTCGWRGIEFLNDLQCIQRIVKAHR